MNSNAQFKKLALGTVQFGLPYGIANQQGQVTQLEAQAILDLAHSSGIQTLDTAIAYGESERVLGRMSLDGFDIVTKLPAMPDDCNDIAEWVEKELHGSLSRLNVSSVDALLLHRPEQLLSSRGALLYKALSKHKSQGTVQRIGVSIYSPDELPPLVENFQLDLIQAPFNIIDKRLKAGGWLEKLASSRTQLHVRSIFMQGLLLMPAASRPEKFNRWSALWSAWDGWLEDTGLTPLEACIRYALSISEIEKVVIGVDSSRQLKEILQAVNGSFTAPPAELACSDINLLNPSLWSQL